MMNWCLSDRADPVAVAIADRHYNRQKPGTPQFVPPGTCIVMLAEDARALWVSSWPFAEYVKHAWAGAWVNSLFRNEGEWIASDMIRQAVAVTRHFWNPPQLGMITFIDPRKVKPTMVRGKPVWGWTYMKAGFRPVGKTKGGLLAFQLLPEDMPEPELPLGIQLSLFQLT